MRVFQFMAKSICVFVLFINSGFAHNSLVANFPEDGAVLNIGPEELTLRFSDSTYLETIEIYSEEGVLIDIGFEPSKQASNYFSVPLPELVAGEYQVDWLVIGDDTHEIKGEFTFIVNYSD